VEDKELIKTATQFTKGILGKRKSNSMCFVVSIALQGYLSILGIESTIVEGEIKNENTLHNHFWLKLSDGRILDATADQFLMPDGKKMPRTFLDKKPKWYKIIKK
jgi:hypothetical protein